MTMNERRAEIMRILTARRSITMPELARTFQVTTRTIQNDVVALTVDYPLETQQGNSAMERLSFSYSLSPGFRSLRGLYAAAFNRLAEIF